MFYVNVANADGLTFSAHAANSASCMDAAILFEQLVFKFKGATVTLWFKSGNHATLLELA